MEPIKLKKNQEVESIRLKPADNGGCSLSYCLYTPAATHTESMYEDKMEVYTDEEMETVVFPRILELYKADYANSMVNHKANNPDQPVAARG